MRFSGHETFAVREGWLHKGLRLLCEEPEKLFHEHAADYLGVGSNMAKSIRHWLQATGLAEADEKTRGRIKPTLFGKLILENDPYFIEVDTWWLLHVNLVTKPVYADSWYWFFNIFNLERFDRSVLVENLRQYVQANGKGNANVKTLDRDAACLLLSYSRNIPADNVDPEESRDCPFRDLGLLRHYRASGYFQLNHSMKPINPYVFGYCTAKAFEDAGKGDLTIHRLIRDPGGPGRAFVLTSESLYETLIQVTNKCDDIRIFGHAGQRAIALPDRNPISWAKALYAALGVTS